MKLTVTPLERPSHAKRQGLHYHICVGVDVLSKHVPCSPGAVFWSDKQHIWWDIVLCLTVIFHTGLDSI